MTISIVIPAYNEEKYLPACLASIQAHRTPEVIEVIVVDNASTDSTARIAATFPGVRVAGEERKGLTRARQRGLQEARGELIAYMDADTRLPAGWLPQATAVFAVDHQLVCLSGPYEYYDLSSLRNFFVKLYWTLLALPVYWLVGYMVVGGNFIAKKSALQAMGGFDSSITFYGEDTDVAARLHRFGKVKFMRTFIIHSSGRRLAREGLFLTSLRYCINYAWVVLWKRPFTKEYRDIR